MIRNRTKRNIVDLMTPSWLLAGMLTGLFVFAPQPNLSADELQPPLEQLVEQTADGEAEAEVTEPEIAKTVEATTTTSDDGVEVLSAEAVTESPEPTESALPLDATDDTKASHSSRSSSEAKRRVQLPDDFGNPLRNAKFPERPTWVGAEPYYEGNDFVVAVSSDYLTRPNQCKASLDAELEKAVDTFIQDHLGNPQATYFLNYDIEQIRAQLLDKSEGFHEFSDTIEVSLGSVDRMHQSHAVLRFTPEFCSQLDAKWSDVRQTGRVVRTAGVGVGMLVVLSMLFGYFRVDSATKGYYTRRLQMLLVTALAGLVAAGVFYYQNTAELIYRLIM